MDKNLPKDPLEEFFKKSLEAKSELPSEEGWDVPSSNVWDEIEKKIQPVATVRVINYWKWATIAASLILLFFAYQWNTQQQQIETLTTEVNKNNTELKNVKELLKDNKTKLEKTASVENTASIITPQHIDNQEVASKTNDKNSGNSISSSTSQLEKINKKNKKETEQNLPNKSPVPSTLNEQTIANSANNISNENIIPPNKHEEFFEKIVQNKLENISNTGNDILKNNNTITNLDKLPILFLEAKSITHVEPTNIALPSSIISDLLPPPTERGIYAGLFLSRNIGTHSIAASNSNSSQTRKNRIATSKGKSEWTFGGGAKIGYQFNKHWSLESGIQYTKTKLNARHRIEKKYTSDHEMTNSGGELESDYTLSLTTSVGDATSNVSLARPAQVTIPEQMPFRLVIESTQQITALGIPILAKYSIGNNNFKAGLKAGLLTNFIINSDIEIKKIGSPLPTFRHRKHRINDKREIKNLKKNTFDLTAGIEAEFKINNSTFLSLEPSFSRSLTPIFEKENVKTFPMMASVKIGVNYRF